VVTAQPIRAALPISSEEATATPGAAGDPFRVIESLPGVTTLMWPLPLYSVRGANPGNTGFLLDGIKVPSLFHLALGPSVIHPLLIDRLDFYPGSYPVQFGRSVGGLVSASTAAPPGRSPARRHRHPRAGLRGHRHLAAAQRPWEHRLGGTLLIHRVSGLAILPAVHRGLLGLPAAR
jgi:hypothetical protein